MKTLGLFQDPSFRRWLGGIEPAWALLDDKSLAALRHPPSPMAGPICLAADFSPDEIGMSAVARNALILLHSASVGPGLKLTATGNLSRSVVAEMCDLFTWPGFDKADAFRLHKVINEPDFLPLFFVRHAVEASKLVRQYKGLSGSRPLGDRCSKPPADRRCKQSCSMSLCGGLISAISVAACIGIGHNATSALCSGRCRLPQTTGSRATA